MEDRRNRILLLLALLSGRLEADRLLGQEDVFLKARRDFGVGESPQSAAVGDFNGDMIQDLAVANRGSDNVSILLGKRDGIFLAAQNFEVGNSPYSAAVADFNQDSIQDLAVANDTSHTVSILLGKGDAGGTLFSISWPAPELLSGSQKSPHSGTRP